MLYECHLHPDVKKTGAKTGHLYQEYVERKLTLDCGSGSKVMPEFWKMCKSQVNYGWAVGGEGDILPEQTGVPMCERWGGATFYLLEIHYDNPRLHRDIVDRSGLKVYYTDKLRPTDSGVLTFASMINEANFVTNVIPPKQAAFLQSSFCTEHCTGTTVSAGEQRFF